MGQTTDIVRFLQILIVVPLLTFALVVGAEMIPDEPVADALIAAGDDGPMAGQTERLTFFGTLPDRWTECTALTMGLGDSDLSQPVSSALHSRTSSSCTRSAESLQTYIETGELTASGEYYRYWWADTALLRPSVLLFGMNGSRVLFQAAASLSFLALFWAWRKRIGSLASLAFLGPIVVATDFLALYEALPQAISVAATLLTSIAALHWSERSTRPMQFFVTGTAVGAFLNPFDLMISIPLAATLCVATAVLVQHQREAAPKTMLVSGLTAGAGWGFGYGWVWATKWIAIAASLGPTEVLENVRSTVAFRVNGEVLEESTSFLDASSQNVSFWFERGFAGYGLLFEVVLVFIAVLAMLRRAPGRRSVDTAVGVRLLIVASTAVLPFVWFEFASNHSIIHDWIMFRAVAVALGLVSATLILVAQSVDPKGAVLADAPPPKELVHS